MCLSFGARGLTTACQLLCWCANIKGNIFLNDSLHNGFNVLTHLFLPTCQNSSLRSHIKLIFVQKEKLLLWIFGEKNISGLLVITFFICKTSIYKIVKDTITESLHRTVNWFLVHTLRPWIQAHMHLHIYRYLLHTHTLKENWKVPV